MAKKVKIWSSAIDRSDVALPEQWFHLDEIELEPDDESFSTGEHLMVEDISCQEVAWDPGAKEAENPKRDENLPRGQYPDYNLRGHYR